MLRVPSRVSFREHRSGWDYVMDHVSKLSDEAGVLLIDFVESFWGWNLPPADGEKHIFYQGESHTVPYSSLRIGGGATHARLADGRVVRYDGEWVDAGGADMDSMDVPGIVTEPFVCFLHNPPNIPEWFDRCCSPDAITSKPQFVDSLRYCEGIYVFSDYLKRWLLDNVGVPCPVDVLTHPTEEVERKWTMDRFMRRPPQIVQVGYWLRRMHSIYAIDLPDHYRRVWLYGSKRAFELFVKEAENEGLSSFSDNPVEALRLDDDDYDRLLAECVVLIDVYDSSCNNAIIESIVRHTPALVRRLPPTEEYLGADYPLFFDDLAEASRKARDIALIAKAHEHMKSLCASGKFSGERLVQDLEGSFVYRKLRGVPRISPFACVSLGVDCFPRAMLTKYGYKRKKAEGEPSAPFDLAYHHPGTVLEMLRRDFDGFWEPGDLFVNQDGIIMHRNGSMFNHESDTEEKRALFSRDGFAELRARYLRRADNFRGVMRSASAAAGPGRTVVFVAVGNSYPIELRDALREAYPGLDFHVLTINLLWRSSDYRDTLPNVEYGSPEAEANGFSFYSVRRPRDGYTWYDANDFSSDEGRDFELQVERVFSRVMRKVGSRGSEPTSHYIENV